MGGLFHDPRTVGLICVYASVAIDFLGLAIVWPILPSYVTYLGGTPEQYGLMLSAYSIASVLSGFWMPWFSDTFGRRKAFIASLAGSCLGSLAQGLSNDFWQLLVTRFLAGLFGGSAGVAMAYIADVAAPHERPKYFSYVGTIIMCCVSLGPAFGQGVAALASGEKMQAKTPLFFAACLAAVALLVTFFNLRDPKDIKAGEAKKDDGPSEQKKEQAAESSDGEPVKHSMTVLVMTALVSCLKSVNYNVFPAVFGFFIKDEHKLGSVEFAFAFSIIGFVMIANNILIFQFLIKRFNGITVGIFGSVVCALGTFFVPVMPTYATALLMLGVQMIGNGLIENILPLILASQASPTNTARILAIGTQAAWAGHIGGPPMYSSLSSKTSYTVVYTTAAAFALLCAVVLIFLGVVYNPLEKKSQKDDEAEEDTSAGASTAVVLREGASYTDGGEAVDNPIARPPAQSQAPTLLEATAVRELQDELGQLLLQRNYAHHLQGHDPAAKALVLQILKDSLPVLPAGREGKEHVNAWKQLSKNHATGAQHRFRLHF